MADTLEDTQDFADEIFEAMQGVCSGRAAADVVYALGMMVARAVKNSTEPDNPDLTLKLIREIVSLELER